MRRARKMVSARSGRAPPVHGPLERGVRRRSDVLYLLFESTRLAGLAVGVHREHSFQRELCASEPTAREAMMVSATLR